MLKDEVVVEVPKHLEIMQNLPFHLVQWKPKLNFPVDVKIGPNMGQLEKWPLAA
jgi:hypothetical protein